MYRRRPRQTDNHSKKTERGFIIEHRKQRQVLQGGIPGTIASKEKFCRAVSQEQSRATTDAAGRCPRNNHEQQVLQGGVPGTTATNDKFCTAVSQEQSQAMTSSVGRCPRNNRKQGQVLQGGVKGTRDFSPFLNFQHKNEM